MDWKLDEHAPQLGKRIEELLFRLQQLKLQYGISNDIVSFKPYCNTLPYQSSCYLRSASVQRRQRQ